MPAQRARSPMWCALVVCVATVAAGFATSIAGAPSATAATPTLPAGFTWTPQPSGQDVGELTDFEFLPNGGLISIGEGGTVSYVAPDGTTTRTLLTLDVGNVQSTQLGLLNLALAPDYESTGELYLFYTVSTVPPTDTDAATIHLASSRWTTRTIPRRSPKRRNCSTRSPRTSPRMWAVRSSSTRPRTTTRPTTRCSSRSATPRPTSRLTRTRWGRRIRTIRTARSCTSIPTARACRRTSGMTRENPHAVASQVYAKGFREPFKMSMRPGNHTLYVGDVGWNTDEEIDVVQTGPGTTGGRVTKGPRRPRSPSDRGPPCRLPPR